MKHHLCEINIETEMDIVLAHKKTVRLCKLAGLHMLGQTQMGTAVAEIARNTIEHATNGKINFYVADTADGQVLEAVITDTGDGLKTLAFTSDNINASFTKGRGINASKKMVDHFHIASSSEGTTVLLQKNIFKKGKIDSKTIDYWMEELIQTEKETQSPYEELKARNQQLIALAQQLEEKNEVFNKQIEEINTLNSVLDRKNQSLVEFAYTLSHDLKNPLYNIIMLTQLARKSQNNDQFLEKIEISATVMNTIIKSMMQIIDIDQDASGSVKTLHLQDIVEELKVEYESDIVNHQGNIHTDFKVKTICYVEPYLESIIRNLVSNAIKYHAEERALILKLSTRSEDNYTVLSVSDNGTGIDLDKHQNELFKPFKRLTKKKSGTGIGLHLIKKMIEKNGGMIKVESTPNEGTVFHCYLKAYKGEAL